MEVQFTIDDLPSNKKNCGNCTRKGLLCERSRIFKNNPNGFIYNSCIKNVISGLISCCSHYTGPFENVQLDFDFIYDD